MLGSKKQQLIEKKREHNISTKKETINEYKKGCQILTDLKKKLKWTFLRG